MGNRVTAAKYETGRLLAHGREGCAHGRDDQVIPLAASQTLLELLPDAQLHVFNKCGHWTQIEQAERFVQLVTNFLNEANIASQTGT